MDKENEVPEIVGSRDLREVFDKGRTLKGGLFINGVEIQPFEANGISGLLASLNAQANRTFVDASIDDGYRLVLEARSPGPISIRAGRAYSAPAPAGDAGTAQAVAAAIRETKGDKADEAKNTILDDLGLDATDDRQMAAASPMHPAAGMTAEQRHKARHERAMAAGAIRGFVPLTDRLGNQPQRTARDTRSEDERFNPTPSQRRIG
jgi:hypothetical protein